MADYIGNENHSTQAMGQVENASAKAHNRGSLVDRNSEDLGSNVNSTAHNNFTAIANGSSQVQHLTQLQSIANGGGSQSPIQRPANKTGLPDQLKSGIERLGGFAMDDVKVHYNSSKPAQLQAHAYAQGTDIHIAPGQERHLPHEAWHVVQQKQGRVKPTLQLKGIAINDDSALETEADVMGEKALNETGTTTQLKSNSQGSGVAQLARKVGLFGVEAEVVGNRFYMEAKKGSKGAALLESDVNLEEYALGSIGGKIDVTLDNGVKQENEHIAFQHFTVEFVQKAVDPLQDVSETLNAWKGASAFWKANREAKDNVLHGNAEHEDYAVNPTWKGGQFDQVDAPGVVSVEDQPDEATLDWRNDGYRTYIKSNTDDPEVSMQLTIGATLLGLIEAYSMTAIVLGKGTAPEEKEWGIFDEARVNNQKKPELQKYMALVFLLGDYIKAHDTREKRYGKEYMSLMSRTSLDMIFGQLSPGAKNLFVAEVGKYVYEAPNSQFLKFFKKKPSEKVIKQKAHKEPAANEITIEDMLLSIVKKKKGDLALEDNAEAKAGDAFCQNGLAGISEINSEALEMIAKFGLNHADEMMADIKGLVFESRAAKSFRLSEMGGVFTAIAATLKKVEALEQAAAQNHQAEQIQIQAARAAAAKKNKNKCVVM